MFLVNHCIAGLPDGEVEPRLGEGLRLEREVPPLAVVGLEAVLHHDAAQQQPVLAVLLGDAVSAAILAEKHGVRGLAEVVEYTSSTLQRYKIILKFSSTTGI